MMSVPVATTSSDLTTWLELEVLKTGTDNQRERHLAGVLPEDELTTLARVTLFAPFAAVSELRRWAGRDRADIPKLVKHLQPAKFLCTTFEAVPIDLETSELGDLTSSEWTMLKTLKRLAGLVSTHPWLTRGQAVPAYNHTRGDSRLTPCSLCRPMVEVVAATHWATCKLCQAEACRSSAKVSISWAGRTLVREWAL